MFHQLSQSEIADINYSIESAEEGRRWLLRLRSLHDNKVKSNEVKIETEKSEGKVISRQQYLSA